MDQYIQMILGSATGMIAAPIVGYAAWLQTTGLLAVFTCLLGMIAGQDWWTPVGRFWWKNCALGPLRIAAFLLGTLLRGLADLLAPAKKSNRDRGDH